MPLRFIQPARCVVTATSADIVTIASPTGSRPSAASDTAERLLRRRLLRIGLVERLRHGERRRARAARVNSGGSVADVLGFRRTRREAVPLPARLDAEGRPQRLDLHAARHGRVIQRIGRRTAGPSP